MLFDLSFLDPNRKWLPPSELARIERYEQNEKLYDTDHEEVFGDAIFPQADPSIAILFDFPRRLSNLWASLLVGEPPTFAPPTRDEDTTETRQEEKRRLADLVQKSGLRTALRECVVDMSRFGDGLLKTRLDEDGVKVEAISPRLWFPVASRANVRKIEHHVLAWKIEENRGEGLMDQVAAALVSPYRKWLYAEIHSEDGVEYRLHELNSGDWIGKEAKDEDKVRLFGENWMPSESHGAGGQLIVHVPNRRTSNRLFGHDDYKSCEGTIMEIEKRLSQWGGVNNKHGNPIVAGPPIAKPEAGSVEAAQVAAGEHYIEVEPDGSGMLPAYIQRDINVESIKSEIEELKEQLFISTETSPAAFGVSRTGYAESGTSLALRMLSEGEKSNDMRESLDEGVKRAVLLASALSGAGIEDCDVGWKDGLPQDETEATEREAVRVEKRLSSYKRAIMRLYDLDEQEAEEEMERIDRELSERQQKAGDVPQDALQRTRQLALNLPGLNGNDGTPESNGTPE